MRDVAPQRMGLLHQSQTGNGCSHQVIRQEWSRTSLRRDHRNEGLQFEATGTPQNHKVYARHGAAEPIFGVSYAELNKAAKRIKTDHALAQQLWASGNHDARVLALRVADPTALYERLANRWLSDVDNYILAEGLGGLCAQSPAAWSLTRVCRVFRVL